MSQASDDNVDKIRTLAVGDCVLLNKTSSCSKWSYPLEKKEKKLCYSGFNGFNIVVSMTEKAVVRGNHPGFFSYAVSTPYYLQNTKDFINFQSTTITYIKDQDKIVVKY